MERTLVWGNRGASGYAPENTMTAFEKAVELGADGIELDVQLTKDGELVVIHDETIDRVSDGSGWVKDFTYAKLIKHNFNRTHTEYEHAQIPTLEEVYAPCLRNACGCNDHKLPGSRQKDRSFCKSRGYSFIGLYAGIQT